MILDLAMTSNSVISKKIELSDSSGNSTKQLKSGEGFNLKIESTSIFVIKDKEFSNYKYNNKQGD